MTVKYETHSFQKILKDFLEKNLMSEDMKFLVNARKRYNKKHGDKIFTKLKIDKEGSITEIQPSKIIYDANDYNKFKFFNTNRDICHNNVIEKIKGICGTGRAEPLTIAYNKKKDEYIIADGQHRIIASYLLHLPLPDIILYDFDECLDYNQPKLGFAGFVKLINTNSYTWDNEDFLASHIKMESDFWILFSQLRRNAYMPDDGVIAILLDQSFSTGKYKNVIRGYTSETIDDMYNNLGGEDVLTEKFNIINELTYKVFYYLGWMNNKINIVRDVPTVNFYKSKGFISLLFTLSKKERLFLLENINDFNYITGIKKEDFFKNRDLSEIPHYEWPIFFKECYDSFKKRIN